MAPVEYSGYSVCDITSDYAIVKWHLDFLLPDDHAAIKTMLQYSGEKLDICTEMAGRKNSTFLKFLFYREHGLLSSGENCITNINEAHIIAEDKSAIPDINKACELSGHSRSTFLVSFSPDRTKVASTHGDHTVRVTELKTGKCSHILKGHPRTPWSVAFHPSSNEILATGCLGGEVRIWDLRGGGSEVWKSDQGKVIASLAFHPSDQVLVIATNNELLFWDWSRSQPFASCKTNTDYEKVRWCKFDPFGHYLYTGIANKSTIQTDELDSGFTEFRRDGRSYRPYRDHYRRVADDITSSQNRRSRMQGSTGLLGAALFSEDEDRPQSPTHSTALRDAQQYAATLTQQNRRQQRLNAISRPNLYVDRPHSRQPQPQHFSRIEIGRVEGPSAPDFENTDDHMQQIHRIPNVYAASNSGGGSRAGGSENGHAASGHGLETLANAAEVVSHMDTVISSSNQQQPQPDPDGQAAARTSQPFSAARNSSNAARHLSQTFGAASSSGNPPRPLVPRRAGNNGWNSRRGRDSPFDIDTFLDNVETGQIRISPVSDVSEENGSTSNGTSGSNNTTAITGENPPLIPMSESATLHESVATPQLSNRRPDSSLENSSDLSLRMPQNTSQSRCTSSEIRAFFDSVLPNNHTDYRQTTSETSQNNNRPGEHHQNNSLFAVSEFPSLDAMQASSQDGHVTANENTDQNSVDSSSSLTVQIGEQSDVEENTAPAAGLTAVVGTNLWENFENNTLNIEIPNMTPNSDDSSSFSGPMRTPRNSADVNRPQQPQQLPAFPTVGLIRPVSPMRNQSSPTMRYNYPSRVPSFARLLDNTLQMAQSNMLQSTRSGVSDDADRRRSSSTPSSTYNSQPASLSRPNSLSPTSDRDSVDVHSEIVTIGREPVVVRTSLTGASSAIDQSAPIHVNAGPSHNLGTEILTGGAASSSRDRSQVDPLFSSSSLQSSSHPTPSRGRNLMHLLETPFPLRSESEATTAIASDSAATDIPQPALPSSFALPFHARNQNVRTSASGQHTCGRDRLTGSSSNHPNHRHSPTHCNVCQNPNLFRSRFPMSWNFFQPSSSLSRNASPPPPLSTGSSTTVVSTTTVSSTVTSVNSSSNSTGSRQPQRLASIIESEVRQAIDSIHSRRISVSDTMRDLDHLQRNLADVPEWPMEEDEPEVVRLSPVPREEVDVINGSQDLDPVEQDLSNSQSSDSQQDSTLVSSYLNNRIEVLNRSVDDLQRRLRQRIDQLEQNTAAAQNMLDRRDRLETRVHHYSQLATQRQRERRQRMQRRLEAMRRRHRSSQLRTPGAARYRSFTERHPTTENPSSFQNEGSSFSDLPEEIRSSRLQAASLLRRRIAEGQQRQMEQDFAYRRITEEALNQANEFQSVMNGIPPFMSNAEPTVSNSIVNLTHRVQRWNISGANIPTISDPTANVVIPYCKLHNDATADISQDGKLLAMFIPSNRNFPDDTLLGVFSLEQHNLGQCLYTKSFDPNAISVSLSPLNNYVLVGLAVRRLQWVFSPTQMVAQIYKLETQDAGEDSMKHICDLLHPCDLDLRMQVSVNSARWLPTVGEGVVYCTNRGDLHICKPGWAGKSLPSNGEQSEDRRHINTRQLIIQLLRINSPRTNNSATQTMATTTQGVRRSASTQTDSLPAGSENEWDWANTE